MSDYFIADDLSGALDAAAAFHHAGRRVTIALSPQSWPEVPGDEVVGVTTETRNVSPDAAAEAVTAVIARGRARGARLLYKKIDSTLRGPVAAEIQALAAAMPEATILFCPANPRVGRTVCNGVLLVNGVPVADTDFARDPVCPVRESSIGSLLSTVAGSRLVIADAATDDDLSDAVARIASSGKTWVAVGSGALARPVAALQSIVAPVASAFNSSLPSGPILFVCGSANPANREQAERLARECHVTLHEVSAEDVRPRIRGALDDLRLRGVAVLRLGASRSESALALRAIVTAARAVISETRLARVFVTGGETAFALGRELQIETLRFQAEVEPGLSLSTATTAQGLMRWAVKPGGFGDEYTWLRGLNALRAE